MSSFRNRRFGLRLSPRCTRRAAASPAISGPDISWLSRCRVGDDQGQNGACAIFAMASWSEIVHGVRIADADRLALYRETVRHLGRTTGDGLTFPEAFAAALSTGWLPGANNLVPGGATLTALNRQPLIAGYMVTPGWEHTNAQGCLDHSQLTHGLGYHAVVIAAHGSIAQGERLVYVENSWSLAWGWNGIGVMTEALHRRLVREVWTIA